MIDYKIDLSYFDKELEDLNVMINELVNFHSNSNLDTSAI